MIIQQKTIYIYIYINNSHFGSNGKYSDKINVHDFKKLKNRLFVSKQLKKLTLDEYVTKFIEQVFFGASNILFLLIYQ